MELREVPKFILCPECNEKYNDAEKRRVIDSCGHPRCFTCLYSSPACPCCSKSKQIASSGTQSPSSQGYIRWKPRSTSVLGSNQSRMLVKNRRSRSLCQLYARNVPQKSNSHTSERDAGSQKPIDALEDSDVREVGNAKVQKEESVKLDRKLSFSSVLNRNSESYKQSRFRRASSFSFMPRDCCSTTTNDKVLEFESNLKIRHRPRPKSWNLSHNQDNEGDSPLNSIQCEHGIESKIEPQGRKTRLDSIVEMAAAWLEESKSVMQSQCSIAESFNPTGEEEQAKPRKLSVNTDLGLEMKLASHGREKLPETATEHQCTNTRQDTTGGSNYVFNHEKLDTKSVENVRSQNTATNESSNDRVIHFAKDLDQTAHPLNTGTNEVSSDEKVPFAKDLESCVVPNGCTDDGSYLQDIRELLKGMKKKESLQEEDKHVMNADCGAKSPFPRQYLRLCEDDIDETPRTKSQNCFTAYDSPFLDDRKDKEIKRGESIFDHCDGFRIDAGVSCEKSSVAADEPNTNTTYVVENPLIVKESKAIDSKVNEQQEIHLKTNSIDSFPGWDTFDKQTETQTPIMLSQHEVHRDAMTDITYCVSDDQLSQNELESGEDKTYDSFPETCVSRSSRPRSYCSKVDANDTRMELLHLPPMRKKRSRSASNLGPHKYEWDKYADLRKSGVDLHHFSSMPTGHHEPLTFSSLKSSSQQGQRSTDVIPPTIKQSHAEASSFECIEDEDDYNLALQAAKMNVSMDVKTVSDVEQHSADTRCLNEIEKWHPLDEQVDLSTIFFSTEECSKPPEKSHAALLTTSQEAVEKFFTNKTDDWKTVNSYMLHERGKHDATSQERAMDDFAVQDMETPVVFVNGEDFCTAWVKEDKMGRKQAHAKHTKKDKRRSCCDVSAPSKSSSNHGIGYIREKFQKLTRWSKKGAEICSENDGGKRSSTGKQLLKKRRTKSEACFEAVKNNSKIDVSFYDVNKNINMPPELVRSMKEVRKIRRRKLDKEEGCSLNKQQFSKKEKHLQSKEELVHVERNTRHNDNRNSFLKPNEAEEASLTTVSTLVDNSNQCSDSDSSVISENASDDDSDSSDSIPSGHFLHSTYSTSSDTINESIDESQMPVFRSPSRIQDDLAGLLERKVTRKRQGLEEINFLRLIPATKGKALVSRDWLYEQIHGLLDKNGGSSKRVVLLSGGHGCGKTTLLKSLVWSDCTSNGKKRMRERISNSILSFHFCSRADSSTTSVAKFILNMATRLVENNHFAAYTRSLSDSKVLNSVVCRETAEKSPEVAFRDGILKPLNEIYGPSCSQVRMHRQYLVLVDNLDHECNHRPEECITSLLANNIHLLPSWITLVIAGTKDSLKLFNERDANEIDLENIANWDVQSDVYCFTEMALPILSSQLSQSKLQKLVDNIIRFSKGSFHVAHMSVQYLSSSFASYVHQPSLNALDVDKLVGHLFKMKFCITERSKILALSLLDVLLVSQELLTLSNLFKTIESSCTNQSFSFQEYESCVAKLLQLEMISESTEGRYLVNSIARRWMESSDGLKTGFSASKGHNLLSVYYMKTLTNNDGKYVYRLAYHLSQSNFGEDIKDEEKRVTFLAWTLNQVFKNTSSGFMETCNVYRPITKVYHIFLHTELDFNAFQRQYGAHPIVIASSLKQTEIVSLILQHRVFEETHVYQALEEAIRIGNTDLFDLLINHTPGLSLSRPNYKEAQQSCLHVAVESNQLLTAVELVAIIWNSRNEDDPSKHAAAQQVLSTACLKGRVDVVEKLLTGGYVCDVNKLDNDGNAPMVLAASKNQLIIAKYLVKNHANIDVVDDVGLTPLLASVMNGNIETSEWLVSQDANVDAQDKDGRTPLIYAASLGLSQLVHSLFMEGATLNHQDHYGLTALSHACKNGRKDVVKVLIRNRARTDTEDRHKRTPLFHAYTSRDLRLIQLLLDQGANVNQRNGKGQKLLEIALKEGYLDIAALLLRYGAHVGKSVVSIAESSLGAFLCVVGHLEQRGNIMIKAGKYSAANEDFQRALNIIENSKHRTNKRVTRIKLLCQQDSRKKFI